MPADDDAGFAIGDLVALEVGCLDDDEELIAVNLDLRHLLAVQGILHREWMQAEHRFQVRHLLNRRLSNPDPGEFTIDLLKRFVAEGQLLGTFAAAVDKRCDNSHGGPLNRRV